MFDTIDEKEVAEVRKLVPLRAVILAVVAAVVLAVAFLLAQPLPGEMKPFPQTVPTKVAPPAAETPVPR